MSTGRKPVDFWLFMTVLILISFGTIMVFSASSAYSNLRYDNTYYFLKSQLINVAAGFIAMIAAMNYDYRKLGKLSPLMLAASILLLILVAIPFIGLKINNARRWLDLGVTTMQPSEFAKLAVIMFYSHSLSKRREQLGSFTKGLLPYLVLMVVFAGLLMLEPHLSGTMVIMIVACVILFCAGAKLKHFFAMGVPVFATFTMAVIFVDYIRLRVTTFLDPMQDPQGEGYQIIQSLYAIGSGGLFGKGLGKSLQKFLYIPEPHNDFILSVLAEELGFVGVLAVLLLFIIFIWRGIKIAMNAADVFGSLVAIGITSLVAIQVIFNVAVVTASMPVTGMPLPFFSYGGTSLVFLMAGIGVLLNISRYAKYDRL